MNAVKSNPTNPRVASLRAARKSSRRLIAFWLRTLVILLAMAQAQAQWGSIRGNNRSAPQRSAPASRAPGRAPAAHAPSSRPAFNRQEERGRSPVVPEGRRPAIAEGRRPEPERRPEEERHFEGGGAVARGPEVEGGYEPRIRDFDEERRHGYYWNNYSLGAVLGAVPAGYVPLYVGGNPYDYYQGVYYQPSSSGYIVVTPPLGAVVPQPPPGAEAIPVGPTVYYYAAGAFYLQEPQGFVVVAPPPGIIITYLPPGAVPVNINGAIYYQADGAYFLAVMQNGVTVYETVQP